MGVDQSRLLVVGELSQASHTVQIDARLATKHSDQESLLPELPAERTQAVQAGEHKAELVLEAPGKTSSQHFGATHLQRVQNLQHDWS
jgi:hypothetical protein